MIDDVGGTTLLRGSADPWAGDLRLYIGKQTEQARESVRPRLLFLLLPLVLS